MKKMYPYKNSKKICIAGVSLITIFLMIISCKKNTEANSNTLTKKDSLKNEFLIASDPRWLVFALDKAKKDIIKGDSQPLTEAGFANLNFIVTVQDIIFKEWLEAGGTKTELETIRKTLKDNFTQGKKLSDANSKLINNTQWDKYQVLILNRKYKEDNTTQLPASNNAKGKVTFAAQAIYYCMTVGCPIGDTFQYYDEVGHAILLQEMRETYGDGRGTCKANAIMSIIGAYYLLAGMSITCTELQQMVGGYLADFYYCDELYGE